MGVYYVPEADTPVLLALLKQVTTNWPTATPYALMKQIQGVADRSGWQTAP